MSTKLALATQGTPRDGRKREGGRVKTERGGEGGGRERKGEKSGSANKRACF